MQLSWHGVCGTRQRAVKGTGAAVAPGCCWRALSQDRHLQLLKVWTHTDTRGIIPPYALLSSDLGLSPQPPLPPCHCTSLICPRFLSFHSQAPAPPPSHLQPPAQSPPASQPGPAADLVASCFIPHQGPAPRDVIYKRIIVHKESLMHSRQGY